MPRQVKVKFLLHSTFIFNVLVLLTCLNIGGRKLIVDFNCRTFLGKMFSKILIQAIVLYFNLMFLFCCFGNDVYMNYKTKIINSKINVK